MIDIKSLIHKWQETSSSPVTGYNYSVKLSLYDAARIEALSEMFPEKTREQIITELLSAALDEVQASFPYVKGKKVIAHDEFGDPVYEDAGLTSIFLKLTRSHLENIEKSAAESI